MSSDTDTTPNNHKERTVAIVGRPNVGKSALFNRLAGRRIAIVHDEPGVTRDRIQSECTLGEAPFSIIDTGGIGTTTDDDFSAAIRIEADIAMAAADLILFVVDAVEGLTGDDIDLAKQLRKTRVPIVVVANKIDTEVHENLADEFTQLGFADTIGVSAVHGRGINDIVRAAERHLPEPSEQRPEKPRRPIQLAMLGRPNVGKSSLINALLGDERTIVSDVAGTTRDAVDVPFSNGGLDYLFIDTAGIRQRNKRDTSVEVFSAMRSERSIRRADLCALVIDCSVGVTSQDRKIARLIRKEKKPCVVVLNKYDLFHPGAAKTDRLEMLREEMLEDLQILDYAPMLAASALKGQFVKRIFMTIDEVRKASAQGLTTGRLNTLLQQALQRNPPPARKGKRLKLLYATMAKIREDEDLPIPVAEFILFVNRGALLENSYARYLEGKIRAACPYVGLPVNFAIREREKRKDRKRG
ncbi:MAG: GTP-binding protein [Verrucomicrobiales bacterium]|jgi:GTP-binding protein